MAYSPLETAKAGGRRARSHNLECATCAIRAESFCRGIPEAGLEELAQSRSLLRFDKFQTIISAGEPSVHIFNVVSGIVKLCRSSSDGRTQIIGFRVPGDFFATADIDAYSSTAEALTCVEVCRFSRARVGQLQVRYPGLQARLLEMSYRQLAAMEEQMFLLGRKTARERVASFLIVYGRKSYRNIGDGTHYANLPITRADIADFLGLTTETVSRVLTSFASAKIISIGPLQAINLIDINALQTISDCDKKNSEKARKS